MLQSARARLLALFPESCIEAPLPGCRRDRHGFARVSLWHQGKYVTFPAHRLAYWLFVSPPKPGEPVRHSCGNPACINPRHLFANSPAAALPAVPPASEMLEALRYLRDCIESGVAPAMSRVNAAIRRAEGGAA